MAGRAGGVGAQRSRGSRWWKRRHRGLVLRCPAGSAGEAQQAPGGVGSLPRAIAPVLFLITGGAHVGFAATATRGLPMAGGPARTEGRGSAKALGPMLQETKGDEWAKALGLSTWMALGIAEASTIICSATISTCGRGHKWAKALQLLGATVQDWESNTITFNGATSRCEKGGTNGRGHCSSAARGCRAGWK